MDGERINVRGILPLTLISGVVIELFIRFLGPICCLSLLFGGAYAEIILRERFRYGIIGVLLIGALVGFFASLAGVSLDFMWGTYDQSRLEYIMPRAMEDMEGMGYSREQIELFEQLSGSEGFRYLIILFAVSAKFLLYPSLSMFGALLAKGFWKQDTPL